VYVASLVLLGGAAVTLALGIRAEGLGLLYVSIACSVLAWISAMAVMVRQIRRARTFTDRGETTATSRGGG
jgi:hypothetical protein